MSEKTCGNCGNVYATQLLCRHAEEDWEHGSASYYAGVTSPNAKPCNHWVRGNDTIEQRYEQLCETAEYVRQSLKTLIDDETVKQMPMLCGCLAGLEALLAADLGVSLDD